MEADSGFSSLLDTVRDQTGRSLWSLANVIRAVPDAYWTRDYSGAPVWKHIYHTLHSLDRWYVNPWRYREPAFHREGLDNLDVNGGAALSRQELEAYGDAVFKKITAYTKELTGNELLEKPEGSPHTRFHLMMAQHRHLDMHIGMLMGFVIAGEGLWPRVLGLTDAYPPQDREELGTYF